MNRRALLWLLACGLSACAGAATSDDLVFIHHSVGEDWLNHSLHTALLAKAYIDERNDITYGTDLPPDGGRPDSLADVPGDSTDLHHWILWFNDYLGGVKAHDCSNGVNRIVVFKSCFPNSHIDDDGTEPGDPFSDWATLANYRAVFRHPDGPGNTTSHGGADYRALDDVFAENPDTLFIYVTAPPIHYAPWDDTDDAAAHRARLFNNWVKGEWLDAYNAAHPGLNNVAVFDLFDELAYPDDHATHPNRLRAEYGGDNGDSHPNDAGDAHLTQVFATDPGNFIDSAWDRFSESTPVSDVCVDDDNTTGVEDGTPEHPFSTMQGGIDAVADAGTVKVAEGTYYESLAISGKSVTIQGGYPGGTYPGVGDFDESSRDPDPTTNQTTIDGDGSAVVCGAGGTGSLLTGFTIRHTGAVLGGRVRLWRVIAVSRQ